MQPQCHCHGVRTAREARNEAYNVVVDRNRCSDERYGVAQECSSRSGGESATDEPWCYLELSQTLFNGLRDRARVQDTSENQLKGGYRMVLHFRT
jgi:hypothetical protein